MHNKQNPDYGIDAPGLMRIFIISGLTAVCIDLGLSMYFGMSQVWMVILVALPSTIATYFLLMGCLMFTYSKFIKVREREYILDKLKWSGAEQVLDIGCGRGLMLVGAAQRLITGKAIGIDIWRTEDQSNNTPDAALNNARIEGVLDRIEIQTSDMRELPYPNSSFDVVISHWVVHNLDIKIDRDKAFAEMFRVLRPGGDVILSDIQNRKDYLTTLYQLGFVDCHLMVQPFHDAILGTLSFGSFRPATIFAKKP